MEVNEGRSRADMLSDLLNLAVAATRVDLIFVPLPLIFSTSSSSVTLAGAAESDKFSHGGCDSDAARAAA